MLTLSQKEDILTGLDRRYESPGDASMRLMNTIIRYKDQPFFVIDVDTGNLICTDMCLTEEHYAISFNDRNLDISSPRVGMLNYNEQPIYTLRQPARQQIQGFSPSRNHYLALVTHGYTNVGHSAESMKAHRDMINSVYPKLDEVLKYKRGGAISKAWAFSKTRDPSVFVTYHKMYSVGLFMKSESLILFEKDELTESRHNSLLNIMMKQPGVFINVQESPRYET